EMEYQWNERQPAFFGHAGKPFNFPGMEQQLSRAGGLVIELIGPGIRAHVRIDKKCLALLNPRVTIFEIGLAVAERLNLASDQDETGFIGFVDEVIVSRLPVHADDLFSGSLFPSHGFCFYRPA